MSIGKILKIILFFVQQGGRVNYPFNGRACRD